jgi:hypothetical protein
MADEGRDDLGTNQTKNDVVKRECSYQDDGRQNEHDAIERETRDKLPDAVAEIGEQAARCDASPERNSTHRKEDDCPCELLKVVLSRHVNKIHFMQEEAADLLQHARPKEGDDRDERDHAHVAKDTFDLVLDAP